MPNHASAEKRHRQSLKRRARNRASKSQMRTLMRKVRYAVAPPQHIKIGPLSAEEIKVLRQKAESGIAKVAAKGIIHKKTAARLASRLATFCAQHGK
jgi:small subunit ribosomal protein S20